jgi:hypothetical protein
MKWIDFITAQPLAPSSGICIGLQSAADNTRPPKNFPLPLKSQVRYWEIQQ